MPKKVMQLKYLTGAVLPAMMCTLLWGSAFPFIKIGYKAFQITGPFSQILFAGLRFSLAGLLVLLFQSCRTGKLPFPPRGSRFSVLRLGLILTAAQYLFFYLGLANTTGVRGSIIQGTGAFLTVILAHFLFGGDDSITAGKAVGCIVGFTGVVLINLNGAGGSFSFQGEGLMFIATAMFSVGSILSKGVTKTVEPFCASGWQLFTGGLVLIVIGLLGSGHLAPTGLASWGIFLYLAALSSVAFTIWTILLQKFPAGKVAVFNFLTPVFGVLLSALMLKESLSGWKTSAALVLVCAGIILVNHTGISSVGKHPKHTSKEEMNS